jgi:hypothetical protein
LVWQQACALQGDTISKGEEKANSSFLDPTREGYSPLCQYSELSDIGGQQFDARHSINAKDPETQRTQRRPKDRTPRRFTEAGLICGLIFVPLFVFIGLHENQVEQV